MKKIIVLLTMLIPYFVTAQETGIKFEKGLSWSEVKEKAKMEHKNIFVDCYATWCAPCKQMDRETYVDGKVGELVNENFISVKVQMDSTANDDDFIKSWNVPKKQFKNLVNAYPTLLFFSSDGNNIIDREEGFSNAEKFITIIKKIIDPVKGYIALKKSFEQGKLDDEQLLKLNFWAGSNKDKDFETKVAVSYKRKFIDHRKPSEVIKRNGMLLFLEQNAQIFNFNDPLVKYMCDHSKEADKSLNANGYSQLFIDYLIKREMFKAVFDKNFQIISQNPDWKKIEKDISQKFGPVTAKRNVLTEQIYYYWKKKDFNTQVKYEYEQVEFRGVTEANYTTINDMIFNAVFNQNVNKNNLEKAIHYMEIILKRDSNNYHYVDTYANVLYKAGYKDKAIEQSERALALAQNDKRVDDLNYYKETLKKMKNDLPTWSLQ